MTAFWWRRITPITVSSSLARNSVYIQEELCVYPSSMDDNVMYVDIGEDSVHRFKITIEEES